ncbi:unnamed protein product [Cylicostephanus goldi]|uniref:Uncharacterized protein n=1 Tax=Cylicostephanus goldi TaxID=71465 RepID=A0A3P6RDU6_CYLGO|nr:unnamed protein product [Cylicostephanus goldi]
MVRRVEALKDGSVLVDFVDILDRNSILMRLRDKVQQGMKHPLWGPEPADFLEIQPMAVENDPGTSGTSGTHAFNDRVNFIREMFAKGEIDTDTATKFFAAVLRDKNEYVGCLFCIMLYVVECI